MPVRKQRRCWSLAGNSRLIEEFLSNGRWGRRSKHWGILREKEGVARGHRELQIADWLEIGKLFKRGKAAHAF